MKKTILEEIDKFIKMIKGENQLPTLEIICDSDSFEGLFKKKIEDELERDIIIKKIKNSSLKDFEVNNKDRKRWWIFYNRESQKFEINSQSAAKATIGNYSCDFLQSYCDSISSPKLKLGFDSCFVDKIFKDVYNKDEHCSSHESGSLISYLNNELLSKEWLLFLKNRYKNWHSWKNIEEKDKEDIEKNRFFFSTNEEGGFKITPRLILKQQITPKNDINSFKENKKANGLENDDNSSNCSKGPTPMTENNNKTKYYFFAFILILFIAIEIYFIYHYRFLKMIKKRDHFLQKFNNKYDEKTKDSNKKKLV